MNTRMRDLVKRISEAGALRAHTGAPSAPAWPSAEDFERVSAILGHEYNDLGDSAAPDTLADIGDVFGLDETDRLLLWAAAAVDLDANIGIAYGLLRGTGGTARPTVGLLLELAGVASAQAEGFARLAPTAPLRQHRLLEVIGTDPWLTRTVRCLDGVVATMAGGAPSEPAIMHMQTTVQPLTLPGSAEVARAVEQGVGFVWIRSQRGAAGASLAAGALTSLGLNYLAVDARRHPAPDLSDALALAARDAGLLGRALIVIGAEAVADAGAAGALDALTHAVVPVVAVGTQPWNPAWLPRFPYIVDAEPLRTTDRAAAWRRHLGEVVDSDPELRQTLVSLRFTPEDIAEAARYARMLQAANEASLDSALVRDAARRVGGARGAHAERVDAASTSKGPTFDDLVLPDDVLDSLRRLVSWGRYRSEVDAHGALRRHGRGIAALFAGSPGTGKTLAAHVIAEELSVDLFQVELSAVIDKYIGETEKNLERVFQAAEALDVVLFFDEADALFGSRSEVRDARDRYANQEIAYLLQRMEQYEGITILATNLRGNLDRAFSRRMSYIVHFPDPDAPTRERLWTYHLGQLPALDEKDPVPVTALAERVEVTGGDIRNIVLAAAYDALSASEQVGMRHVAAATVREYRKLGKVVPEAGFLVTG